MPQPMSRQLRLEWGITGLESQKQLDNVYLPKKNCILATTMRPEDTITVQSDN